MFTKELISWDPLNGIAQYHHYDADTGTSIFESVGDAGPVLEHNKAIANETQDRGIKEGFWLYASIPTILQLKWLAEEGIDVYKKEHQARVFAKLNDPQYRHLKTTWKKHTVSSHD